MAVGVLGSLALLLGGGRGEVRDGTPNGRSTDRATGESTAASASRETVRTAPTATAATGAAPTSTPAVEVPSRGSGGFVTAHASGAKVGLGSRPLRYVVEVETGLDVSPAQAAHEIEGILGAPRGWTHDRSRAFQLVSQGQAHDLKVVIATPATADALCWAGGRLDTEGEYNCEIKSGVVVNLKRWVQGSPMFDGPIHDYRALIINHEMGHFLGFGHMTCPGPGRPAPVMMQQIKGLHGCVANAWPYDSSGHLVSGPPAP
ncbi:DUF3152 domain-containing protein [Streptomyces sp. NPDC048664]|uniref:DUF3152 domain-containing protein n=1 Tax=Streptomyces sp. NPDC048664 TaxID=3154505 RepID=UPI00341E3DE0